MLIEHKNKTRGSLRVYKSDLFYNPMTKVKRVKISDGTSTACLTTASCTKALTIILNRVGIMPQIVFIEGKRLRKAHEIDGLLYDSIRSIKGDHDHLRLNYSTLDERGEEYLADLILSQSVWLKNHKIVCGEFDGTLACIRGKCLSLEDLKKMQKKLIEYSK